jgi:phage-related protein
MDRKITPERAQMNMQSMMGVIVALTVAALVAAFLLPVAINALESDTEVTLTQDENTLYEVNAELDSTVTSSSSGTSATVELNTSDQTISNSINVGENATYDFDEGAVTANVTEAQSTNATVRYSYPSEFSYSGGASGLWGLVPFAIILVVFLAMIRFVPMGSMRG